MKRTIKRIAIANPVLFAIFLSAPIVLLAIAQILPTFDDWTTLFTPEHPGNICFLPFIPMLFLVCFIKALFTAILLLTFSRFKLCSTPLAYLVIWFLDPLGLSFCSLFPLIGLLAFRAAVKHPETIFLPEGLTAVVALVILPVWVFRINESDRFFISRHNVLSPDATCRHALHGCGNDTTCTVL